MRRPLAHLLPAALVLPLFAACGDDGAAPAADTTADVGADIQDTTEAPDSAGDSSGEDTATEDTATEDTATEDTTPVDVAVDTTEPPSAGYIPVANGSIESAVALPATTPAPDGWRYYTYFTNPAPASWVVGYAEDYGIEAPDGDQVLVVSSPSANAEFRYNDTPVDTNIQPGDLYIISAKVRMLNPGTTAYFAVGLAVSDRPENIVETELNPATVEGQRLRHRPVRDLPPDHGPHERPAHPARPEPVPVHLHERHRPDRHRRDPRLARHRHGRRGAARRHRAEPGVRPHVAPVRFLGPRLARMGHERLYPRW
jgi:hypothetical protein